MYAARIDPPFRSLEHRKFVLAVKAEDTHLEAVKYTVDTAFIFQW